MNRTVEPIRRTIAGGPTVVVDRTGLVSLDRESTISEKRLCTPDLGSTASQGALQSFAHRYRYAVRQAVKRTMDYVILVPTLRCNLNCSYCQVSRVNEGTAGYDWGAAELGNVLAFLGALQTRSIKIEFQGGEPFLRLDLLEAVRNFCTGHFDKCSFVVCTNLQNLTPDILNFIEYPDVFVSTSLDGGPGTHTRQRTNDMELTREFRMNLREVVSRFGTQKISALPTVDFLNPPSYEELITAFTDYGISEIYLRPINYQGFARKVFSDVADNADIWTSYYLGFIDHLIKLNAHAGAPKFSEYYFSLCLRRILAAGHDSHVDLRNPNYLAQDYIVIDHDGAFYPTDEARMVTRTGLIDLSVGDLEHGLNRSKVAQLNQYASNDAFEECRRCPYQAFCGTDIVDDISRYGTIDVPKDQTWFCRVHTAIFDRAFQLLSAKDPDVRFSMNAWAGALGKESQLVAGR